MAGESSWFSDILTAATTLGQAKIEADKAKSEAKLAQTITSVNLMGAAFLPCPTVLSVKYHIIIINVLPCPTVSYNVHRDTFSV